MTSYYSSAPSPEPASSDYPPPASTPLAAPTDDSTSISTPPLSAPTPTYTSSTPPSTPSHYTSPPAPPTPPPSGPSVGIIVGIVVGAVAFVLLFSILFIRYRNRRKNKSKRKRHDDQGPQDDEASKNNGSSPSSNERPVMPEPQPSPPAPWRPLLLKPSPRHPVTRKDESAASNSNNSSGGEISNPVPPPAAAANPSPLRITVGFSKNEFTYEELAQATDGFCDANFLGQGGFGCVHRGHLPDGKEVAVKQLKAGGSQGEREFQAEIEIISRVHHRHLVSLVGYCITGTHRLLVYEFVPNKTLGFHLHEEERPAMDWPARMRIALGAAKGLAYLHEDCHPKVIHRDIKAANILLDSKFEAKVADFGLAKFCPDINTHVATRVMGTLGYLAPEYALSGKLTDKSDVFSFGVVLLELITGRRPVDSSHANGDSLVEWAMPLLPRALEDENFDILVDPRLQNRYDPNEMVRMVACAAASIRYSAKRRPRMSQIVRALEGEASLADLNDGIRPGQSTAYASGNLDYDAAKYKENIARFRKMVLGIGGSSEVSGPTSEYGIVNPSDSSSGESQRRQTTRSERKREMEMTRKTNNTHGTS